MMMRQALVAGVVTLGPSPTLEDHLTMARETTGTSGTKK